MDALRENTSDFLYNETLVYCQIFVTCLTKADFLRRAKECMGTGTCGHHVVKRTSLRQSMNNTNDSTLHRLNNIWMFRFLNKKLKSLGPMYCKFHGHGKNDGFVLYEYTIKQFSSFCKYTNISVMKKNQRK